MKKIPEPIKKVARNLRKSQTLAEKIIWEQVRDKKLGYKIQRQFPIFISIDDSGQDRFIIPDFYCSEKKAIIEIDGDIHNQNHVFTLDKVKEELLQSQGYTILRITNEYILDNPDNAIGDIQSFLLSIGSPSLIKRGNSRVGSARDASSQTKQFIMRNENFTCDNCNKEVSKHPSGSARNHCPFCLYSKHLDNEFPGDRASECCGMMKPVGKNHKKNKGWMIEHECITCHKKILNKLAEDDDVEIFGRL